MEFSPLIFLDNDMAIMLSEQVRLSREEEARRFHDNLFHYGLKLNEYNHKIICKMYEYNNSLEYSYIGYLNDIIGYKNKDKKNIVKTIKKFYKERIKESERIWCRF